MATVWEENFAIRSIALNASTFTDVLGTQFLPIDCNTVVVLNISVTIAIALRSDPNNANSEVTVGPGQQWEIGGNRPRTGYRPARFKAGDPVCSLKLSLAPSRRERTALIYFLNSQAHCQWEM